MAIRGGMLTTAKARDCTITAVVTRADGSVENLGTVAYWHRNPLKRFAWNPFKRALAHAFATLTTRRPPR